MNSDFYKDEYLNILYGIIKKVNSKKIINIYFIYIDYFNLNKNLINYDYINYIGLVLPILLLILILIIKIKMIYLFIYKI